MDEFELERNSLRVNHFSELHMNKYKRRNLLAFQWGHSEDELKEARSHTKKMQRQRSMTQLLQPVYMAEEAIIDIRNFITKKKTKKSKTETESAVPQVRPPARATSRATSQEAVPVPRSASRAKSKEDETGVPQYKPPARAKSRAKSEDNEVIAVPRARSASRAKGNEPESFIPVEPKAKRTKKKKEEAEAVTYTHPTLPTKR